MSNSDLLAQFLLGQAGQQGQRADPRRALASRLMAGSPPAAPITNSGAGLAYALTQGLDAFTGARMDRDAEIRGQERQDAQFRRLEDYQTRRRAEDGAAVAAITGRFAPQAAPFPAVDVPFPAVDVPMGSPAPARPRVVDGNVPDGPGVQPAVAPAELMPIIERASQETGIPVPLLVAKLRQESNFDPNARGRGGEIGLAQIMPRTAGQPGFGVAPADPASLRDPEANIMFGARYLAGRGRAAGVTDWNDPEQQNRALQAYNGGGDPNYVANVRRWMPPPSPGAPGLSDEQRAAFGAPVMPANGPAMPASGSPSRPDAMPSRQQGPRIDPAYIDELAREAARGNAQAAALLPDQRARLARQDLADRETAAAAERAAERDTQRRWREQQTAETRRAREEAAAEARRNRQEDQRMNPTLLNIRRETEDTLAGARSAGAALSRALELNPNVYSGVAPETRAWISGNTGFDRPGADATAEYASIMTEQALNQLRAIFGGNPTEGERKILLEMGASTRLSETQREALIRRAQAAVAERERVASDRLQSIVSGEYTRTVPGFTTPPPPDAAPSPQGAGNRPPLSSFQRQ